MHQVVVGLVVQGQNSVIVGNDSVSLQGQLSSLGRIVLSLDLLNQSVIIGVELVKTNAAAKSSTAKEWLPENVP